MFIIYNRMKRGRPNLRHTVQQEIIEFLTGSGSPATISSLLRGLSVLKNRKLSWNTIQKYVQELVESGKLDAIQLPHSKIENRSGLVMYTLKK